MRKFVLVSSDVVYLQLGRGCTKPESITVVVANDGFVLVGRAIVPAARAVA